MDRVNGRPLARATAAVLLCGLAACGSGSSGDSTTTQFPAGTVVADPATGFMVIIENNLEGNATKLQFVGEPLWGRLVDVAATDPATLQERTYFVDYLVGQDVQSGPDYRVERNPATGRETVTILHVFDTAAYDLAFARLTTGLQAFLDKSLNPAELPPYTTMPRNAAMVLRFNDLVDPATVSSETIHLDTGYPPLNPFEPRIVADPNHGDFIAGTFYSTRVIIDMSVSQAEADAAGIPPNPIGLPEAITATLPNVVLRIPTRISVPAVQFKLLRNLSGRAVGFGGNGATDPTSLTLDVVRAFRSGGGAVTPPDPFNGFLRDVAPPRVLGSQDVTVNAASLSVNEYLVDFTFATPACGTAPAAGDLLALPLNTLRVTTNHVPPTPGGQVSGVRCELISGSPANVTAPVVGEFRTPWRAGLSVSANCFVRFTPDAGAAPNGLVSNNATILVAFDEPMYPPSLNPFDGMVVQKNPPPADPLASRVLAVVTPNLDLQEVNFSPMVPLDHVMGQSEAYTVQLMPGVTDLAGNPLAFALPQTSFTLDDTNPTLRSGSIGSTFTTSVTGFAAANVDDSGDGLPEYRGQFIHDVSRGEIRPRSLTRFSAPVDSSQPSVAAMLPPVVPPNMLGTQPPLSRYGSRVMTCWRYFDMGLNLLDESTFNVDVEGLAWSPVALGLSLDNFPDFQMRLAHCLFLPDEAVSTTGAVLTPSSGLSTTFASNVLDPLGDPLRIVHARTEGYLVQPLDQFVSTTGTTLAPWPMNRNKAPSNFTYYTYRDTAVTALGGPFGNGADPMILSVVDPANYNGTVFMGGSVPTIGLPLLMEFKTYPNNVSVGTNLLNVVYGDIAGAFGLGGAPSFRVHSTGGALPNNNFVQIDPDQQITAIGGLDIAGNPTFATDSIFYLGQADFVVRVSRIHSAWFDAKAGSNWVDPILLPAEADQPGGTSISFAYRGALMNQTGGQNNAANLNMYGEKSAGAFVPLFLNNDKSWKTSLAAISGARFMQVRITMISNPESQVSPVLSALGFAHFQ